MGLRFDVGPSGELLAMSIEIQDELDAIRARMGDTRPLLRAIGAIYYASTMARFSSHTNPKGQSWKHLKPDTIHKKKTGMGNRRASIEDPYSQLVWTGTLRSSLKVNFVGLNAIQIGVNRQTVPYAAVHQFGHGYVPARPYLGVTKAATEQVGKVMEAFIKGQKVD